MSDTTLATVAEATAPTTSSAIEPFLFLYITEKCQLRCQHCYMGDRLDAERRMSPAMVAEILAYLRAVHGQYKVYLLGGEPTTHPQFDEILDVCHSAGYKVVLTSNGLIPAKMWPILDRPRLDSFSFSMDGARAATHEAMRGPNTFRPLLASMRRAIDAGFQTRAIFTVTTANRDDVFPALDLADDVGLEMLSFHYFTPTGLGSEHPEFQLSPPEWMGLCQQLRDAANRYRTRIFYPPAFVDPTELGRLTQLGYRGCTARNLERLAIFPDGRVYICSAFFDTDLHYGTWQDGQIVPRLPGGRSELTLVNQLSSNCRSCPNGNTCRGGCAAYDFYERTLVSSDCDRSVVPVCPLWSVPALPDTTASRLRDLR